MNESTIDWSEVIEEVPRWDSRLKKGFAKKYNVRAFFAYTEAAKEALWAGLTVIFVILAISYFSAHFMLYVTGYYDHTGILTAHARLK